MKRNVRALLFPVAFALAGMAVSAPAESSVSLAALFEQTVANSEAVAVVTPIEQKSVTEEGRIVTYSRVHVDETVAGKLAPEVWIATRGGTVGKIAENVDGEPLLFVGYPTFLFLRSHTSSSAGAPAGTYVVTARAQGQFEFLPTKPESKERLLTASNGVGAIFPRKVPKSVGGLSLSNASTVRVPTLQENIVGKRFEEAVRNIRSIWESAHAKK